MSRVAAIDCGTNSIRLLVAKTTAAGRIVDLDRQMEIVRLGEGVDRTGRLAPEAIERTRLALARYVDRIARLRVDRIRMVATSASRDAENADDFRSMVSRTLGQLPEVVSGDEEARLTFDGAVRGLPTPGPYLVFDIGGGSTEFVVGSGNAVDAAVSVDVGCVRMTERHLRDDPPGAAQVEAARADIAAEVGRALDAVDATGRELTLVGVAGTVTTVAALTLGLPGYDPEKIHHATVSRADVDRVTAELLAKTVAERRELPVMHPGRADVIGAGALILRTVMELTGAEAVVASEHDILDGVAWSLVDTAVIG